MWKAALAFVIGLALIGATVQPGLQSGALVETGQRATVHELVKASPLPG